jgi:hypothetical protein
MADQSSSYKALDVDLRCPATLKVISKRYLGDESARLRFLREARAAARVRQTNVASDCRVDDPAFGDQRLLSLSPTATARWRRNPMELIER